MKPAVRVGIVCEGRTDFAVLEQVVLAVFGPCEITTLQPMRDQLDATRWSEAGWTRVRSWCEDRGASGIADEMTIGEIEVLVIHVDGDVCGKEDLPRSRPDLCSHILNRWIGPPSTPPGVVICIPAMASDTWLAAALAPSLACPELEADPGVVDRLHDLGVQKNQYDYGACAAKVRDAVPALREALPELERFVRKLEAFAPERGGEATRRRRAVRTKRLPRSPVSVEA